MWNDHTQMFLSISFNKNCSVYSRTSPNDHLSRTATYFVLVGSPYIDSRLNLVTTATSLQRQRQRPPKRVPNCQKKDLSTTASFFQRLMKKSKMIMKFYPYAR